MQIVTLAAWLPSPPPPPHHLPRAAACQEHFKNLPTFNLINELIFVKYNKIHKPNNRAADGLLHGDKLRLWLLSPGIHIHTVVSV